MGQCVALIYGNNRCQNDAQRGYKFCEEHKTRPKAIQEREEKVFDNVVDATQVFEGSIVEEKDYNPAKPESKSVGIPREQQTIYQKATGSLDKALDWEELAWEKVLSLNGEWRYEDKNGMEQMRSEVAIYEKAMDRVIRAVTAMAKLDIEAQSVNVNKLLKEMIKGVVLRVLQRMELSPKEIERARLLIAEEFEKIEKDRTGAQ